MEIATCFWFDHEAEEAVELYTSLVPGSRILAKSHYGKGAPMPEGSVLTVTFELGGVPYMALNGGPHFRLSEAASIVVACDSQEEIDRLWHGLLAGGGAESRCGWLKDRFGMSWQILPRRLQAMLADADPGRRERVWAEVMRTVQFDIARLEQIFNG